MTLRCKVGDSAWIVNSAYPENVGRVVRVVRLFGPCGYEGCTLPAWEVRSDGEMLMGCLGQSKVAYIHDVDLRPIRPSADPQDVTRDEELTV